MIYLKNHLGGIELSRHYFNDLVIATITNCFGVAGLSKSSSKPSFLQKLPGRHWQPVRIRTGSEGLEVDLHILMVYGVNISQTVRNIQHKIQWAIEENTGFSVHRVKVYVDSIKR